MKPKLFFAAIVIAFLGISNVSFAQDGHFAKTHPRRAEVNRRTENQGDRIHDKVKDGQMSKAEAEKLHHQDRQIHQEQKAMASQNHGHITKQEQKTLNQQENHVSKEIKRH